MPPTEPDDDDDAALVGNPDAVPLDPPHRGARAAAALNGVVGFAVLLAFLYLGEGLRQGCHLPLPAPVIGLAALAVGVVVANRLQVDRHAAHVEPVARLLLAHMGLLFVPAGTGILIQWDLVRAQWAADHRGAARVDADRPRVHGVGHATVDRQGRR